MPVCINSVLGGLVGILRKKGLRKITETGKDESKDLEEAVRSLEEGLRYLDWKLAVLKKERDRIVQLAEKEKMDVLDILSFIEWGGKSPLYSRECNNLSFNHPNDFSSAWTLVCVLFH